METERKYFTLVFEGDIAAFQKNPLKTETPFGVPIACGKGDAFAEIDALSQQLEDALEDTSDAYRDGLRDAQMGRD